MQKKITEKEIEKMGSEKNCGNANVHTHIAE